MSCQSAAFSSGSNSIPLANQTIGRSTSGLLRRLRHLYSRVPHTLVCPLLSPLLLDPLEYYDVDPVTTPHIDDDPDWVNAPIPVSIPVF